MSQGNGSDGRTDNYNYYSNRFTALWILSGTTRVSRYQKKHSPTHLVINHPYLLPPSTTIHGILPVQFTCLTVFFHNLSPSFLWSTSWPGTLHFIPQSLSSFRSTCSYRHNLSCCSTEIMSSNPISLSTIYLELFLVA